MFVDVSFIRQYFIDALEKEEFVTDKTGCKMLELPGACFLANEPAIFGTVNEDYVQREIQWYESQSLNVNDIPPPVPQIWKQVATPEGFINSNYGWCIYSGDNCDQFMSCVDTLKKDPESRRAIMIYTRPSMQFQYNLNGMSDFMCTNTVQYLIRNGEVHAIVNMRSNDCIYGLKNDLAWQKHILTRVSNELDVPIGDIIWQCGSLHIYQKHFYLVDHCGITGEITISKKDYDIKYPLSRWK
jgi:thymidylate synthase